MSQIQTHPDDLQDMYDAVAAGLRVTTAQRDIAVDTFTRAIARRKKPIFLDNGRLGMV